MGKKRSYYDATHFYGRIWTVCAVVMLLLVPVGICVYFDASRTSSKACLALRPFSGPSP